MLLGKGADLGSRRLVPLVVLPIHVGSLEPRPQEEDGRQALMHTDVQHRRPCLLATLMVGASDAQPLVIVPCLIAPALDPADRLAQD